MDFEPVVLGVTARLLDSVPVGVDWLPLVPGYDDGAWTMEMHQLAKAEVGGASAVVHQLEHLAKLPRRPA